MLFSVFVAVMRLSLPGKREILQSASPTTRQTDAPALLQCAVIGSRPLFLIAGAAAGEDMNLISSAAACGCLAPVGIPAAKTVTFWTSGGNGPSSSIPGTGSS